MDAAVGVTCSSSAVTHEIRHVRIRPSDGETKVSRWGRSATRMADTLADCTGCLLVDFDDRPTPPPKSSLHPRIPAKPSWSRAARDGVAGWSVQRRKTVILPFSFRHQAGYAAASGCPWLCFARCINPSSWLFLLDASRTERRPEFGRDPGRCSSSNWHLHGSRLHLNVV